MKGDRSSLLRTTALIDLYRCCWANDGEQTSGPSGETTRHDGEGKGRGKSISQVIKYAPRLLEKGVKKTGKVAEFPCIVPLLELETSKPLSNVHPHRTEMQDCTETNADEVKKRSYCDTYSHE